jgi:hypothetical protein
VQPKVVLLQLASTRRELAFGNPPLPVLDQLDLARLRRRPRVAKRLRTDPALVSPEVRGTWSRKDSGSRSSLTDVNAAGTLANPRLTTPPRQNLEPWVRRA